MAMVISASAARWQPKWILSGRLGVSADSSAGLPEAPPLCMEARKGTIRCMMPVTKVSSQPNTIRKPHKVATGAPSARASPAARLAASSAQPTHTMRKNGSSRLRMRLFKVAAMPLK